MEGKWNIELWTERTQLTEDSGVHVHFHAEVKCRKGHTHSTTVIIPADDVERNYYATTEQLSSAISALTTQLCKCETTRNNDDD